MNAISAAGTPGNYQLLPFTSSINREAPVFRRGQIAEDELRQIGRLSSPARCEKFFDCEIDFALGMIAALTASPTEDRAPPSAPRGDFEHVVLAWIDAAALQPFRSLGET